jgi:hypothetical protein
MKSVRVILLSLFSIAVCASAAPTTAPSESAPSESASPAAPSTQPSRLAPGGREGRITRGEIFHGNNANPNLNPADSTQIHPPTQDEIDATLKFTQENFPVHYSFFAKLAQNGRFRNKVAIPRMVERYRTLMRLKEISPDAYAAMMQQAKLQDDALGLARDLKNGSAAAESKLRESISSMVDQSLSDRQARIMKLRRMLDEQQAKLDQDQRNRDKLVAEQIDKTEKEAERMLKGKDGNPTSATTNSGTADATTQPSDELTPSNAVQPVNALTNPAQ